MKKKFDIAFIGSGNVATQLALAFKRSGHTIVQICGRNITHAKALARKTKSDATTDFAKLNRTADFYFICVNDDEIKNVIKKIKPLTGIVVHTSGTTSLKLLQNKFPASGVFYPLQTIRKNKPVNFTSVPILVEGSDKASTALIKQLAKTISSKVNELSSDQRKTLHLAAVIANNFSNHLFSLSESVLRTKKIPASILYPLVLETLENWSKNPASANQTGPAKRGDAKIIREHLKMLANTPNLRKVYKVLTESIILSENKGK